MRDAKPSPSAPSGPLPSTGSTGSSWNTSPDSQGARPAPSCTSFPSKRAILEAALQYVATRLAERYGAAREATDVVDALASVLPLDETRQREWRVWVSYFGIAGFQTRLREAHHDFYEENRRWVRDILEDAVARGEIRPGLPLDDIADQIIGLTDGIGVRANMDPDAWGAPQQRALMAAFVGLLRA